MRRVICLSISMIINIISVYAFEMTNMPVKTNHLKPEEKYLIEKFKNFAYSVNDARNTSIVQLSEDYEDFGMSIFYPISRDVNNEINSFLQNVIQVYYVIKDALGGKEIPYFLRVLFKEDILPDLELRISLARLDKNNLYNEGLKSIKYGEPLRGAIKVLTGKLFEIKIPDDKNPEYRLGAESSAVMINWSNGQINNLNQRGNPPLNAILACAHAIEKPEHSEFYFVQSKNLNLETGVPDDLVGLRTLVNFLRESPNSFRIDKFSIKDRIHDKLIENVDISMSKPRYFSNEDVVIGHIDLRKRINQNYPRYDVNYNVNYIKNINYFPNNTRYYALGYPGCQQYKLESYEKAHDYPLIKRRGVTPLFITVNKSTQPPPRLNYGIIERTPPTAKGMSGGPLYYLENGEMNIFGLITSGKVDDDFGCPLF